METEAETTSPEVITLKAKDGQGFPVKKGVLIRESGVIADLLNACECEEIPLPDIPSGDILQHIVDFLVMHEDSSEYKPLDDYRLEIDPKDEEFLKKFDGDNLVVLLNSANYLNIPRLCDAGLLKIRNFCIGKTAEELRRMFRLPEGENNN